MVLEMVDVGWVAKGLADWLLLLSLLFDIDGYLKRYAGGLVGFDV
ncbi:hypothetical protein [Paenirhodobacter populi]|nr:hypothetical protein [Sinirhodobacter populi]